MHSRNEQTSCNWVLVTNKWNLIKNKSLFCIVLGFCIFMIENDKIIIECIVYAGACAVYICLYIIYNKNCLYVKNQLFYCKQVESFQNWLVIWLCYVVNVRKQKVVEEIICCKF